MQDAIETETRALAAATGVAASDVQVVVSPYRICPLGAHVDHQGGAMLGMAVSACTILVYAPSDDATVRLTSADFDGDVAFPLERPGDRDGTWADYARGAGHVLRPLLGDDARGLVGRVRGSLPGSGLSSSASVVLAYLSALAARNGIELDDRALVESACAVENDHLGVRCGILDPASIVASRRGALLHIDARTTQWRPVQLGDGAAAHRFLVAASGTDRSLASTGFNDRVQECCDAAAALARAAGLPPANRLGDVPTDAYDAHVDSLPASLRRRALHYRGETTRVADGARAWADGDVPSFGRLMNESGRSSIENYECGTPVMAELLDIVQNTDGVLGARFSGAGFGGCCIALVEAAATNTAQREILERFVGAHPELDGRARCFAVDSVDGLR